MDKAISASRSALLLKRWSLAPLTLAVSSTLILSASVAFGEDVGGFQFEEGGSFSQDRPLEPSPSNDDFGGNFGGSFDNSSQTPAQQETLPDRSGDTDGFGGSFGTSSDASGGSAQDGVPQASVTNEPSGTTDPVTTTSPEATTTPAAAGILPGGPPPPTAGPVTGAVDSGTTSPVQNLPDLSAVNPPVTPEANPVTPDIQVDEKLAFELQDFGVPPTAEIHQGPPHGPTPLSIPGGTVVTTDQLDALTQSRNALLLDVLGGQLTLPNAVDASGMGRAGVDERLFQEEVDRFLANRTNNDRTVAIILFCSDPQCWLSYNAALRAMRAGYSNVYWYRGGLTAWQKWNRPVVYR